MPKHLIHRGLAKKNFKENTISAFKYCFKKKLWNRNRYSMYKG